MIMITTTTVKDTAGMNEAATGTTKITTATRAMDATIPPTAVMEEITTGTITEVAFPAEEADMEIHPMKAWAATGIMVNTTTPIRKEAGAGQAMAIMITT